MLLLRIDRRIRENKVTHIDELAFLTLLLYLEHTSLLFSVLPVLPTLILWIHCYNNIFVQNQQYTLSMSMTILQASAQ